MDKIISVIIFAFRFVAFGACRYQHQHASQAELRFLQDIDPAKTTAIINYREEKDPFASIEDLKQISGTEEGAIKHL